MNDLAKVKPNHTQRTAFVYIRQSSPAQVEYNASPPRANMLWSTKRRNSVGPRNK
jgi:hypothetical protein